MTFERILKYCKDLETNNNRTFFKESHPQYEQAKRDYLGFLDFLRFRIAEKAPDIGKDIMYMEPKEWTYRIARDMRYYHGNEPYNPTFRAYISANKKSWMPIGYYLKIGNNCSCFGTGIWCEKTEQINKVRNYILENSDEFLNIIEKNKLTVTGDSLKNVPKHLPQESLVGEYLKMKNWMVIENIPNEDITDFESFDGFLGDLMERMEPMRQFFLDAVNFVHSENID